MKLNYSRYAGIRFPYMLALMVALVLADGVMTEFLVSGGLGREGNVFLSGVSGGMLMVFKVIGALVCSLILWDVHRRHPNLAFGVTLAAIALYTGVVYWNIFVFVVSL